MYTHTFLVLSTLLKGEGRAEAALHEFSCFGKPRIVHKLQQEKACAQGLFMQVKDLTGKEKSKPHTRGLHHRIATHNPGIVVFLVHKILQSQLKFPFRV